MTPKAVIRGEFHISKLDRKRLLEHQNGEFQALFIEGRGDFVRFDDRRIRYNIFLIGWLTLMTFYETVDWIFARVFPFWYIDIKEEARNSNLLVHDDIDLDVHILFRKISDNMSYFTLIGYTSVLLFFITNTFLNDYFWITPIPSWVVLIFVIITFPMIYAGILIIFFLPDDRNQTMAQSIIRISEENGYEKVLFLTGDAHVAPVSEILEDHQWDVTSERSAHPIPRFARLVGRVR